MAADNTPNEPTKAVEQETAATKRAAAATKRSTTAKKAATTRARKRTIAATERTSAATKRTTARARTQTKATATKAESTTKATAAETQTAIDRVGDVAERALLTSVGAALVARETVEKTINELRAAYGTRATAEEQLRRYERRGTSAREALERDVRNTRTRVERELRAGRERVSQVIAVQPAAPDALARNARAQADLAKARVGVAVETAQLAGATVVAKVSERVASLA